MAQPLHREEQHLPWIWRCLIGVAAVGCIAGAVTVLTSGVSAATVACVPMLISVLFLVGAYVMFVRVVVTVQPEAVVVTTGYLGWPRWVFNGENIESYRPVTFSPLRDFGGWGIKHGRGNRMCINAAGNRGVEIKLRGHKRTYIVGSNDPDNLVTAIKSATGVPPLEGQEAPPSSGAEPNSME